MKFVAIMQTLCEISAAATNYDVNLRDITELQKYTLILRKFTFSVFCFSKNAKTTPVSFSHYYKFPHYPALSSLSQLSVVVDIKILC
ncbi:2158_t:CDS:2 [Diversispora eburnea]|uniref:2158_t:CDS:1 n=1 Tax=Diversispora eburnea TaxID=1213867 RepID=A0A9N8YUC9_9GLOM|nr:2158_t:CDS:2 [Diversispora eburnea]